MLWCACFAVKIIFCGSVKATVYPDLGESEGFEPNLPHIPAMNNSTEKNYWRSQFFLKIWDPQLNRHTGRVLNLFENLMCWDKGEIMTRHSQKCQVFARF